MTTIAELTHRAPAQRGRDMTHDVRTEMQRLNDAAYSAAAAAQLAGDTDLHIALRNLCWWTDAQVDAAAPGAEVEA